MKRVAAEISQSEPRIDVLINNAGAMFGSRQLTLDGLEDTFALNHMAYFLAPKGYASGSWPRRQRASSTPLRARTGERGSISTICNWRRISAP